MEVLADETTRQVRAALSGQLTGLRDTVRFRPSWRPVGGPSENSNPAFCAGRQELGSFAVAESDSRGAARAPPSENLIRSHREMFRPKSAISSSWPKQSSFQIRRA